MKASTRVRLITGVALTLGIVIAPLGARHAAASSSTPFSVTVSGGSLSMSTQSGTLSGSGVTLNGLQQLSTATLSGANIIDARGTGAGWSVSVSAADPISDTSNYLPITDLALVAQTPVISDTSSAPVGSWVQAGGALSRGGSDTTPGTTPSDALSLLSTGAGNGMGSYNDNVGITLTVPAKTLAGTYTTNLVFAVQ